jgi:hypothetical protein
MKLNELLRDVFGERPSEPFDELTKKVLEPIKKDLLKCDEFLLCDDIVFIDEPTVVMDGETYLSGTIKINDTTKFTDIAYIHTISFTPEMFDPNSIHIPVKDGAAITPTVYNPKTFEISRKIVLQFDPEGLMYQTNVETKKQEIRDLLEKVLENPEEYTVKTVRGILLKGVFKYLK